MFCFAFYFLFEKFFFRVRARTWCAGLALWVCGSQGRSYRFMSPHGHGSDDDEAAVTAISNEEWCSWLHAELRACPAYATHGALLDECCAIAARWRTRFWGRKALWNRMRRGSRLAKELAEAAPVLERARLEAQSVKLEGGARVVVIDLCSGFGYMAMFLSELLPPDKVRHKFSGVYAPHV